MAATGKKGGASSLKIAVMASSAAAVEWYDFFLYGTAAALIFPKLFFPADLPLFVAQIASFSTFAVGFIARPLGGVLFGHYGDVHGRKGALVAAMLLMGAATALIGILPTFGQIGVAAPLLLIVLRFAQGLAVGGQWGGAALLAIESAPPGRRGFYGSFVQVGVPLGVVLANAVFLVVSATLSENSFQKWGWRIGFVLSLVLILIGLLVHLQVEEPGGAAKSHERGASTGLARSPLVEALRNHWRVVLLAGGAFVANNVCFYVAITYAIAYGSTTVGMDREVLLGAVMAGSLVMMPALVICGAASDRYGRRGVFLAGAFLSAVWAFAVFPLLESAAPLAVFAAIAIQLVFVAMMYGPQAALFAELFPKSVRYSGASLGYQIGAVVGGGIAPIVATALYARYLSSLPIAVYLAAMCAISFLCVMLLGRRVQVAVAY